MTISFFISFGDIKQVLLSSSSIREELLFNNRSLGRLALYLLLHYNSCLLKVIF